MYPHIPLWHMGDFFMHFFVVLSYLCNVERETDAFLDG